MKTTISERFEQLIAALGVTKNEFASTLGLPGTNIYNIIKGRNAPSFDLLQRIIATYPNINIQWLLMDDVKGPVFLSDENGNAGGGDLSKLEIKMKAMEKSIADLNKRLSEETIASEEQMIKLLKRGIKSLKA